MLSVLLLLIQLVPEGKPIPSLPKIVPKIIQPSPDKVQPLPYTMEIARISQYRYRNT